MRGRTVFVGVAAAVALVGAGCAATPDLVDGASGPAAPPTTTPPHVGAPAPTTVAPIAMPGSFRAATTAARAGTCSLYPPDHFLNANHVDTLPVHPSSGTWMNSLGGRSAKVRAVDSRIWDGARAGIPINIVDSNVTGMSDVTLSSVASPKAYRGKYPIPDDARVQGYPSAQWDKHLLIVDVADCTAYELIQYEPAIFRLLGLHTAMSGIRYPVNSSDRPAITTNAANTPMIGQFLTVAEVNAGRVAHAIGFCTDNLSARSVWPAQMSDGTDPSPSAIPMGAWARLRSDVDLTRFTGQARPIVNALREHGMILTDTCAADLRLMGENSDGWNTAQIGQLTNLSAADFEVVDPSAMKLSEDSFKIR